MLYVRNGIFTAAKFGDKSCEVISTIDMPKYH